MTYVNGEGLAVAPAQQRITVGPRGSTLGALNVTGAVQELGIVTATGGMSTLGWLLLAAGAAFVFGYLIHQPVQAAKQRVRRRASSAIAHTTPTWQVLVLTAVMAGAAYYLVGHNKGAA